VVGSSVGALNASYFAGSPSLDGVAALTRIWLGLRRRDIFPFTLTSALGLLRHPGNLIDPGGLRRLVDVVGGAFAREIFFTARQFDTEEARLMGLVNRVVPDAELEAYVKNYAETIAANAPLTVKAVKYIVGEVLKDESKRNVARCAEMVEQCFTSNDFIEGRRAFMEKRKPAFTGT